MKSSYRGRAMKILIVEDDVFKQRRLEEAAEEIVPTAEINSARSVNGGMSAIQNFEPDLILLDMSL